MKKILHVDDSKSVHTFVESMLVGTDTTLMHAYSAEEALEILKADQTIDLLLLDWEMPGMTGAELIEVLRGDGFGKPIIMVTTRNKPEDILHILSLGTSEYIMKPFTKDILIEKIASVQSAGS